MTAFHKTRETMVTRQLIARGLTHPAVLRAMSDVPREAFVAPSLAARAYEDSPLPIDEGQTISQPLIVAMMAEALDPKPTDRVLEVGAGSGYAAAVLGRVVADVYTIERHRALADQARDRLAALGFHNVHVVHGDGTLGLPERAPYDGIMVAAGGPSIPDALLMQLKIGGRLVIPVGATLREQRLVRAARTSAHTFEQTDLGAVQFVPLIGAGGWDEGASKREI